MDTWELSPGLTACQRRERAGLFPEHRPVVSFPHPVRKQTNPWQRWPQRGPGCGLALTQRKSSFPIFLAIDFFLGGGGGMMFPWLGASPQPHHGSAFTVPGPLVASSEPNPRVRLQLSAYLWHACPACAGHTWDAFTEGFLSWDGFFPGWVPPAPPHPQAWSWSGGGQGPSKTPSSGAHAKLFWPERVFRADPNASDLPCQKLPPNTPNLSPTSTAAPLGATF